MLRLKNIKRLRVQGKPAPKAPLTLGQRFAKLPFPSGVQLRMTAVGGRIGAPLLFVCKHPTSEEMQRNLPLSSTYNALYLQLLSAAGFDLAKDFIYLPGSRYGAKPSKDSYAETLPFIKREWETLNPKIIVLQGMEPFAHLFAHGRKKHSDTIMGNPLYMPETVAAPVFVLPAYPGMVPQNTEDFREIALARRQIADFNEIASHLRELLTRALNGKPLL